MHLSDWIASVNVRTARFWVPPFTLYGKSSSSSSYTHYSWSVNSFIQCFLKKKKTLFINKVNSIFSKYSSHSWCAREMKMSLCFITLSPCFLHLFLHFSYALDCCQHIAHTSYFSEVCRWKRKKIVDVSSFCVCVCARWMLVWNNLWLQP